MQYAIVQKKAEAIDRDAMIRAFKALPELNDTDAKMLARDAFGVLVEFLTEADAHTLCRAMIAQGIDCEVTQQDKLPDLLKPRKLRRATADATGFTRFDIYGRKHTYPWDRVYMVALGAVDLVEESERVFTRTKTHAAGHGGYVQFQERLALPTQESNVRHLIEIFVEDIPERYRIVADAFAYGDLGERQHPHYSANFMILAADIIGHAASQSVLNSGALNLPAEYRQVMRYPSEHSFEEELKWIMLRTRGSSQMRHK